MLKKFALTTERQGLYEITDAVQKAVAESGIHEGICVVYCPHTTGGLTINENCDPDVKRDLLLAVGATFPDRADFRHGEGNSHAHLKSMMTGVSLNLIITEGKLLLGRWQGIYFAEYDGPRTRNYYVKVQGD